MTIRTQMHLSNEARAVLELAPPEAGERIQSLSDRTNLVLTRYGNEVSLACPSLSEAEWSAICDACNGLWMDTSVDAAKYVYIEVHDCEGLDDKWGIDQAQLVDRLRQMSTIECWAVSDVVARFWARASLHEPTREALEKAGAKIVA